MGSCDASEYREYMRKEDEETKRKSKPHAHEYWQVSIWIKRSSDYDYIYEEDGVWKGALWIKVADIPIKKPTCDCHFDQADKIVPFSIEVIQRVVDLLADDIIDIALYNYGNCQIYIKKGRKSRDETEDILFKKLEALISSKVLKHVFESPDEEERRLCFEIIKHITQPKIFTTDGIKGLSRDIFTTIAQKHFDLELRKEAIKCLYRDRYAYRYLLRDILRCDQITQVRIQAAKTLAEADQWDIIKGMFFSKLYNPSISQHVRRDIFEGLGDELSAFLVNEIYEERAEDADAYSKSILLAILRKMAANAEQSFRFIMKFVNAEDDTIRVAAQESLQRLSVLKEQITK